MPKISAFYFQPIFGIFYNGSANDSANGSAREHLTIKFKSIKFNSLGLLFTLD